MPETREYLFRTGRLNAARDLVIRHHYSGRCPSRNVFVCTLHERVAGRSNLFGDPEEGDAVAAILFRTPSATWKESVLELGRLVRIPDCDYPLSSFVAEACHHLTRKGFDLLVSYADPGAGHHGGIYQACSWNYHTRRKAYRDGCLIDGVFIPSRSLRTKHETDRAEKLREILGDAHAVEPHYDTGKHLYWRALNRKGEAKAKRLGLQRNPYPKPASPPTPPSG